MSSSRGILISGLIFKSLTHFELTFVYGEIVVQFSQHHLLKRLSSPHCVFSAPFLINSL